MNKRKLELVKDIYGKKIKMYDSTFALGLLFTDNRFKYALNSILKYLGVPDFKNIAHLCKASNKIMWSINWSIVCNKKDYISNYLKEESLEILRKEKDRRILDLKNTLLKYILPEVNHFESIKIMNARLYESPQLEQFSGLSFLNLENCNLKKLPILPARIHSLFLNKNNFENEIINLEKYESLETVGLDNCGLTTLPIFNKRIHDIDLSNNDFSNTTIDLSQYKKLSIIAMKKCGLKDIPIFIKKISSIDFSNNDFSSITIDLSKYEKLTDITMSNCGLENIPILNKEIEYDEIILNKNKISSINALDNIAIKLVNINENNISEVCFNEIEIIEFHLNNNNIKNVSITGIISELFLLENPVEFLNINSNISTLRLSEANIKDLSCIPSSLQYLVLSNINIDSLGDYRRFKELKELTIIRKENAFFHSFEISDLEKLKNIALMNFTFNEIYLPKKIRKVILTEIPKHLTETINNYERVEIIKYIKKN